MKAKASPKFTNSIDRRKDRPSEEIVHALRLESSSAPGSVWLFFTAVGAFVLTKTKYGNWIFAVGGNKDAARATGVPADKVKTALFMATSLMGAFVGAMILMRLNSVQAQQGDGQEFEYIIAAVVGGNLMTGGYGSVVGASLGALIMAVSKNGIPAAQWNQDGRFIFLGAVLLVAVLVNNYVRKKANEQR